MSLMRLTDYIHSAPVGFLHRNQPWLISGTLTDWLAEFIENLNGNFVTKGGIAIHREAVVESGNVLKAPVIISKGCFVGAHAYLRGGVFLAEGVSIGPGCEIKSSFIGAHSSLAHFNFIGDSLIGSHVNLEAGAIIANHHNDRADKRIFLKHQGTLIDTGLEKFGAIVGDHSKIGANAVLAPGTVLPPGSIVPRLALVDQSV